MAPTQSANSSYWRPAIDRLPVGSVAVGDANFGVFSVAYAAVNGAIEAHLGQPPVTCAAVDRLAGNPTGWHRPRRGMETEPGRPQTHPGMPPDAEVRGRLIVRRVQPSNAAAPFLLALFTGLDLDQDEIFKVYGQRWKD